MFEKSIRIAFIIIPMRPPSVILSDKTPRCGCFGVELSKICNKLLIFESQNAASVLRISVQTMTQDVSMTQDVTLGVSSLFRRRRVGGRERRRRKSRRAKPEGLAAGVGGWAAALMRIGNHRRCTEARARSTTVPSAICHKQENASARGRDAGLVGFWCFLSSKAPPSAAPCIKKVFGG